jgi:hypothetical protein
MMNALGYEYGVKEEKYQEISHPVPGVADSEIAKSGTFQLT